MVTLQHTKQNEHLRNFNKIEKYKKKNMTAQADIKITKIGKSKKT